MFALYRFKANLPQRCSLEEASSAAEVEAGCATEVEASGSTVACLKVVVVVAVTLLLRYGVTAVGLMIIVCLLFVVLFSVHAVLVVGDLVSGVLGLGNTVGNSVVNRGGVMNWHGGVVGSNSVVNWCNMMSIVHKGDVGLII